MGISKRWRSTALNSCSRRARDTWSGHRPVQSAGRMDVAQAPPDVVGLRVLEEPWCASTYVAHAGSSGILPGAGPRPTSSSERQDPASGRRWRSPRRRTCPWVAAILRTLDFDASVGELNEVSPRERREVGTEFDGDQIHTMLRQRHAQLSCAAADLQDAASLTKIGRRDNRIDDFDRGRRAIQAVGVRNRIE